MSDLIAFALARRQSRSNLHGTWLDGGSLKLYTGTRPTDPDTAITSQVLLCTFTLDDPAGTSTDGVFVGTIPEPALIMATGTPTWGRFADDAGAVISDCDVGTTGSGSFVEVENTSFVSGAYAAITSMSIEES